MTKTAKRTREFNARKNVYFLNNNCLNAYKTDFKHAFFT